MMISSDLEIRYKVTEATPKMLTNLAISKSPTLIFPWMVPELTCPLMSICMENENGHPMLDQNSILMGRSPICTKLDQSDTQCHIGIQLSTFLGDAQTVWPIDSRHRTVVLQVSIY